MARENEIVLSDALSFLEGLEEDSVDLVLTDPPYAISRETNFVNKGMDRYHVTMDFGRWDHAEVEDMDRIAAEAYRVLKDSGTFMAHSRTWPRRLDSASFASSSG